MIIDFSVGNFRSIKEVQSINMTAANISSKYKKVDEQNIFKVNDKWRLLKSKAIYGANASGKSNIMKAIVAFINIVEDSVKDETLLPYWIEEFRLSSDCDDKPSFFQMIFLIDGVHYRYGFEASQSAITSEWLFGTPGKKEVQFFLRDGNDITISEKHFHEGVKLKDLVRQNSLFLTVVKSLNGPLARRIVDFVGRIAVVSGLSNRATYDFAVHSLGVKDMKKKMVNMLKVADIGIEDIERVEMTPEGSEDEKLTKREKIIVGSAHRKLNVETNESELVGFVFNEAESEGSKKMFEISPLIIQALESGSPFFMDEFDARFHPLLSKKIVELFNSDANDKNAQLIFATHDTNLLDAQLLRRDQICFVEKDKLGASHFYSLAEFKGVRNDASFEKDYIKGKYGAIPFLGDFESILEEHA
jgi:AAA15 family ATPase/GTPase